MMEAESSERNRGLKREAEEHQNIEKGKALQFELESSQPIPSNNSAQLVSAVDEIRQVKLQFEMVTNSEDRKTKQADVASAELLILKKNLAETREDIKTQLLDCKDSEVHAQALIEEPSIDPAAALFPYCIINFTHCHPLPLRHHCTSLNPPLFFPTYCTKTLHYLLSSDLHEINMFSSVSCGNTISLLIYTHLFNHKSMSPSPQDTTIKASQSPQATAISKTTSMSPSSQDTTIKASQSPQVTAISKITTCRHLHLFEIMISRKANYKQITSLNKATTVSITPY
ncbi:hypothetical protein POM88_032483 [Heracleum sosnowskyi]|uniref:Uncharacterized protein n=1 Tax=Heracleum sosnowskyi TaxID=360622 RepID=A0AAD8MHK2_9APIA|nr:hypothetical protein POM88_032483 [Heracleum sosnowskyi]